MTGTTLSVIACISSIMVSLPIVVLVAYFLGMFSWLNGMGGSDEGGSSSSGSGDGGSSSLPTAGKQGTANLTFFGQDKADDNGEGFTGIDLFKHGTAHITFQGRQVYPVAVHQNFGADFLYKVLEVQGKGVKPILGHVVDVCDAKQSVCNTNMKKGGLNFLVDIHKTGFEAAGTKGDGMTTGTYRMVGEIKPSQLPQSVWMKGGKDYILCSCTGKCANNKEQKWTKLAQCK